MFGGSDSFQNFNDLLELNEELTEFTNIGGVNKDDLWPSPRFGTSASVYNTKLYLFGGWDGFQTLNDLWEFDPVVNTWVQKASLPAPGRFGAIAFSVGNKGYAVDTESVLEVIPRVLIKPILQVPNYVLGSISYGGSEIPVIDFSMLTQSESSHESMHSRIFILSRVKDSLVQYVGILSEKITEAVEIEADKILVSGIKVKDFPYFDGLIRSEGEVIQVIQTDPLMDSMEGVVL